MTALQTSLTSTLGCRYPVIQTAMGWVATPQLVAASVEAGAFGFLAAAVMQPAECEAAIKQIKDASAAPFGVNLHSFQAGVEQIVDACIDHGVAAISYGRAPSAKLIEKRLKPHDSSPAPELMSVLSTSSNELCPVTSIDSSTSV